MFGKFPVGESLEECNYLYNIAEGTSRRGHPMQTSDCVFDSVLSLQRDILKVPHVSAYQNLDRAIAGRFVHGLSMKDVKRFDAFFSPKLLSATLI